MAITASSPGTGFDYPQLAPRIYLQGKVGWVDDKDEKLGISGEVIIGSMA